MAFMRAMLLRVLQIPSSEERRLAADFACKSDRSHPKRRLQVGAPYHHKKRGRTTYRPAV